MQKIKTKNVEIHLNLCFEIELLRQIYYKWHKLLN